MEEYSQRHSLGIGRIKWVSMRCHLRVYVAALNKFSLSLIALLL